MASEDPASKHGNENEDSAAKLESLTAHAAHLYALKKYDEAAEAYSEATALQAEIHGEMALQNAELLYLYGRCLYHVAVSKSDVLGGKVAGPKEGNAGAKKRKRGPEGDVNSTEEGTGVDEKPAVKQEEDKIIDAAQAQRNAQNPFLNIQGDDADWDDEEDDDEDEDEDGEETEGVENATESKAADANAEENDDDLANAYEILDFARVLLKRQIESLTDVSADTEAQSSNAETDGTAPDLRTTRDRLADTYDLQCEISLENERFHDAIIDSREALALKQQLYPEESSVIAEAHFKLSLALEFQSVTVAQEARQVQENADAATSASTGGDANVLVDGGAATSSGAAESDVKMAESSTLRKEAVLQMKSAIASSKKRVVIEREKAASQTLSEEEKTKKLKDIADVEELVGEMEQRLEDLLKPAPTVSSTMADSDEAAALNGIIGNILGQSPGTAAPSKAQLDQVTKSAHDLTNTGLVRKGNKRKAEAKSNGEHTDAKRAKTEEL